ncbi:DUF485 domain-containing protein [Kocuria coralli]|uniref:DUF485 domain-containing protein n=1 Tax=Kocuria coralli TaxID=1461025 RepID=A0A5J5KV29_9MICC|nr:DUF485 domain-containing protein [Kocuria coralli]KAA9393567.1 DUF485 domain-containing protein [Kocuria coralli]
MSEHPSPAEPTAEDFVAAQRSPEFESLRSTHRKFVVPMTVFFLVWFALYVLLSIYATDFMSIQVIGNVNLGIILGLLQFVTTFGITGLYVAFANKSLDPQARDLRATLEAGDFAGRNGAARPGSTLAEEA